MYVSKPPSRNRINLSELSAPPEASNSGFLVVRDRESEQYDEDTSCCCCGPCITGKLLFPQNTILSNSDESNYGDKLLFIPVHNKPVFKPLLCSVQMAPINGKNEIITSHHLYILVFGFGFLSSTFNWARSMRQARIGFALVCLVLTLHILSPKSLHKG